MIKKLLLFIFACLVALLVVMLARTLLFRSRQVSAGAVGVVSVDAAASAARLAQALRFQTVSHEDPARFDREAFLGLHRFFEETYPRVHANLTRETVNEFSLLYTWPGAEPALKPVVLMAHLDVVPIEEGTEERWSQPPFEGRVSEGFVWGRGALDDKAGVVGLLEAVETLISEGFRPRRTVYLAFGHDEEAGGGAGAARIAELLRGRGVEPEFVLDEGGVVTKGIVPGISAPVALVATAEKGFVSVELSVETEGGHSSRPPQQTAIGVLAAAVARLEATQMSARFEGPTRRMLEYVGPEMAFGQRLVMANLWLTRPLVVRQLLSSPTTAASVRTTTAVTIFQGGIKDNVLPSRARAVVNFRIAPGDTSDGVVEHVRRVVADARVRVEKVSATVSEPSPESDANSASFALLQRTIREVYAEAVVAPYLSIGATDARYYAPLTRNVYRFLPVTATTEDLARLHGTNERIAVEDFARTVVFYRQLIRNSAQLSGQ
ncbi:MAG TPA: M20 family peptidase [Pyrinomonadaceae bacterium]|nr:M20 family peptidase [Pyrinomonadaceae bacterium]